MLDFLIIGGGLAGLRAAELLLAQGRRVLVLEAAEVPGGRMLSYPLAAGLPEVDWGAEWVIPDLHHRMMALAAGLDVQTEPEDVACLWTVPGFGSAASYQQLKSLRPGFGRGLQAIQDWYDRGLSEADNSLTAADLVAGLVADPIDRDLIAAAIFPLTGAALEEVSARSLREEIRVHAGDIDLTLAPETVRFTQTAGGLARRLAARLPESVLRLSSTVTRVAEDADGVTVEGPGLSLRGREAILALPVAALHEIGFDPAPEHIGPDRSGRMNAGEVVKFWAVAEGPLPPTLLSVGAPLRLIYTWQKDGLLLLSAQGLQRDLLGADPADLFRKACPGLKILQAEAQDWRAAPGFRASWMTARCGAYPSDAFAGPFGRFHFIGGDVAPEWVGWMEGALASAEQLAERIGVRG